VSGGDEGGSAKSGRGSGSSVSVCRGVGSARGCWQRLQLSLSLSQRMFQRMIQRMFQRSLQWHFQWLLRHPCLVHVRLQRYLGRFIIYRGGLISEICRGQIAALARRQAHDDSRRCILRLTRQARHVVNIGRRWEAERKREKRRGERGRKMKDECEKKERNDSPSPSFPDRIEFGR
jgi:hypothetical protein